MNSRQRRKERRRWIKRHRKEIDDLLTWISENEVYVTSTVGPDGILEAQKENIRAFGEFGARTRDQWKRYLRERGVDVPSECGSASKVSHHALPCS